jgi:hypothetical protein
MEDKGNIKMNAQNLIRSIISGLAIAILYLIIGTVLDYGITQVVSQFFLTGCSEDCYFRIFNSIFVVVVILSVIGGVYAGLRSYKRSSEK